MTGARTTGQRAGLNRDRVLDAARSIVSDGGLHALTMRALASRLGVQPNALYSHVASKDALLEDLLDDALAAVDEPPSAEADWQAGLRSLMLSTYAVLLARPALVPLYLGRGARGPNARHLGDVMLALLERGNIRGAQANEALQVLIVHAIGFAAFATQPGTGETAPVAREAELAGQFERGLDWLLTGIAADARTSE